MKHSFTVKNKCALISAISENVGGVSLPALKTLLKAGEVRLNGVRQCANCEVKAGDSVSVFIPAKFRSEMPKIVFADENIVIVDKPPFFDVENNLLSWLLESYPTAQAVHRLDRNTSGLLVFSLNNRAYDALMSAFRNSGIEKVYLAEVEGSFNKFGQFSAYLTKDGERAEVSVSASATHGSKKIITEFLPCSVRESAIVAANTNMPANRSVSEESSNKCLDILVNTSTTYANKESASRSISANVEGESVSESLKTSASKYVNNQSFSGNTISDMPVINGQAIEKNQSVSPPPNTSFVKIKLVTGRTHQIRAHLAFLGHPVLGDGRYGSRSGRGYALKSFSLTFARLDEPLGYLNGKTFMSDN